jgi:hypothetical protein
MLRWACVLCLAASLVGAAAQVPAKARAAPAAACSWLTLPVLCACAAVALGFRAHAMPKQRIQVLCAVRVPAMLLRSSPCRTRDAQRTDSSASAPSGTAVASAAGMVPPARPWPRYARATRGCVKRGFVVAFSRVSRRTASLDVFCQWHPPGVCGHLVCDVARLCCGLVPAMADASSHRHQGARACLRGLSCFFPCSWSPE